MNTPLRLLSTALTLSLSMLVAMPAAAHQPDPVRQAERAGRWLQLDPQQVEQLAHFFTDVRLQRVSRRSDLRDQLLAVLTPEQRIRWQELRGQGPRWQDVDMGLEERLSWWQSALDLSQSQLAQIRQQLQQARSQAQQTRAQRRAELEAIVGTDKAQRIAEWADRRSR